MTVDHGCDEYIGSDHLIGLFSVSVLVVVAAFNNGCGTAETKAGPLCPPLHCLPRMETCVLPNTQSFPARAVLLQEVQQTLTCGDLGDGP